MPYGDNRQVGRFARGVVIASFLTVVAMALTVLALPVMVMWSALVD
jgi:hypothetical protein